MRNPYSKVVKVKSGLLAVRFSRSTCFLRVGESVRIPAHQPHALVNPCDEDIQILVTTDTSNPRLQLAFAIQRSLARQQMIRRRGIALNVVTQAVLMQMTASRYCGFRAYLNPLMKCIAARATATGEAQRIIKRFTNNNQIIY